MIQRRVENAVSKRLLAGEFAAGDTVLVDHTPDGYTFRKAEVTAAAYSTGLDRRLTPSPVQLYGGIEVSDADER